MSDSHSAKQRVNEGDWIGALIALASNAALWAYMLYEFIAQDATLRMSVIPGGLLFVSCMGLVCTWRMR